MTSPDGLAAVIAFDIVGHGKVAHQVMVARLRGIDEFVARALDVHGRDSLLWVSDGDGGFLLFLDRDWPAALLQEVRNLRCWAAHAGIPLRVAVHYGQIQVLEGKAGRQPVGELINDAKWFLTRASDAATVASAEFVASVGPAPGVQFHDERHLRRKHGQPQVLHLMSADQWEPRSHWSEAASPDRHELLRAVEDGRGFDAIYYAKRLLQVNSEDRVAAEALARIRPLHFRYKKATGEEDVNDVVGYLSPANLRRLISLGQLVERKYDEVLCRRGDSGSTMFIILRGQVGVYNSTDDGGKTDLARPLATHSEGDIVGELAFALHRERTADLVSLGDTALLAFEYEQVRGLLKGHGATYRELMNGRALEHLSQRVPYLIGRQLSSLLDRERAEWMGYLSTLKGHCDIVHCNPYKSITLSELRRRERHTAAGGIFVLASGHLQSRSTPEKQLDGRDFPLLYVDLPDLLVAPDHEYTADRGPARIIFIGRDAINDLPPAAHTRLVDELKHAMHSLYHYDVFLAHNFADRETVERWGKELAGRGLKVFRDTPFPLAQPYADKDGRALLDSLVTLVFVSPHVMVKDAKTNGVLKEVRFRERHFDPSSRIAPVPVAGGDPRALGIMYTTVRTDRGDEPAIAEVADLVRAIRSGEEEPPYSRRRQNGATRVT